MKPNPLFIALVLTPLVAFSQPPPAPPTSPVPPANGFREREPKVPVTFLGVETSEVPNVLRDQLGIPKGFGLVVDYVAPDGPAAAGGVQQNDVLKMFNDQILVTPTQLARLVRSNQEGASVTLTLMRKGKEEKIGVKLGKKEVPRHQAEGGTTWAATGGISTWAISMLVTSATPYASRSNK
ncbi:MAG: PDZ domain-containing protein [Verrucomicrobiota bacterium]|nr:PDZ domain-containing protein [Verrucomicrobiota bacterium]